MPQSPKPDRPNIARRDTLQAKKSELETLIPITSDPGTANNLRADYRAVVDELDLYYDDIKPAIKPC